MSEQQPDQPWSSPGQPGAGDPSGTPPAGDPSEGHTPQAAGPEGYPPQADGPEGYPPRADAPGNYPPPGEPTGASQAGAFPPPAGPAGAQPPGAYPPPTGPFGAQPSGAYPPADPFGAQPPGAYPTGSYPPGAQPPGVYPPGTQPPGGFPAAGVDGRTRLLIIGGGALLVLVMVIGVIMFVALAEDGPEDTVEAFMDATKDRDTAAMADQLCGRLRQEIVQRGGDMLDEDDGELIRSDILNVSEAERTAEVTVETDLREDGRVETETITLILVKEDDRWLICGSRETPGTD